MAELGPAEDDEQDACDVEQLAQPLGRLHRCWCKRRSEVLRDGAQGANGTEVYWCSRTTGAHIGSHEPMGVSAHIGSHEPMGVSAEVLMSKRAHLRRRAPNPAASRA
jgi:hypothetical protein